MRSGETLATKTEASVNWKPIWNVCGICAARLAFDRKLDGPVNQAVVDEVIVVQHENARGRGGGAPGIGRLARFFGG